jgi:hypothetical protein
MTHGCSVRVLLFIGSNLLLLSYKACEEADAHDPYMCVPADIPPSLLGFSEWASVCIFLFVMASGFIVSAMMVFARPYRRADHLIGLRLETNQDVEK